MYLLVSANLGSESCLPGSSRRHGPKVCSFASDHHVSFVFGFGVL